MLNQHHNLIVPLSDWLKIGECVLDIPRREVAAPGRAEPLRITLKAQQVLMVLVSHQGKVVSREALIEWVWPDTLPTDDVLTQAITQLRKAFCEDRDAPRYLETIAKGGYRLLAPVSWLDPETDNAVAAGAAVPVQDAAATPDVATVRLPAARSPSSRKYLGIGLVALAAVAAGIGVLVAQRPGDVTPVREQATGSPALATAPPDYQRITSLPGSETWPSVSPDGGQVVYSAYSEDGETASLMVQTTAPVPPRSLTQSVKGKRDVMPVWSPDGRAIVFTRAGDEDECAIMLVPSSGGEPRMLGPCVRDRMMGYSWHPDGKHLVADGISSPQQKWSSIQVLELDTGIWRPLAYERDERHIDMAPMYSPDGKWIAFQRNISLSDLWRVPATGGRPERLTKLKTNIYGLAWTPDSRAIVFAAYRDGGSSLLRLDIASRRLTDLGVADAAFPSIGSKALSLAFVLGKSRTMLYSLPLDASGPVPDPETVFPSTGDELLPAVAPDGRQIAFVSDRSARLGLWWAELGRPESLRWIEGFIPVARYAPVWSSDSANLLMIGRTDSNTVLYEVTPATARVRRLPVPAGDPIHAEYLPDPLRLMVVADQGAGRLGLILYDRSVEPWRPLASIDDVVLARVDAARQRIVFTRQMRPGLWQADLDLRQPKLIDSRLGPWGGRRVVVTSEGVRLILTDETCGLRWTPVQQTDARPARCLHAEPLAVTGFSYDEVHGRLYFSSVKEESSDIGWMRLQATRSR